MKQSPYSRKSNEEIRDRISMILMTEFSDPRLQFVTVTAAQVSKDRSICNVYVSTDPSRYGDMMEALERAKGRMRSILGRNLGWRVTPELRFMLDETIDNAERIERALLDVPATLSIPKDEFGQPIDPADLEDSGFPEAADDGFDDEFSEDYR